MTPRVFTRREWGARHPDGCTSAPTPASRIYLHHSVTTPPSGTATLAQDIAAIRSLEEIGQSRFGCGISYTYVIPPSGRIFQGHSDGRQGTHTGGYNTIARAICLVGNYEILSPTSLQINAVQWLLADGYRRRVWSTGRLTGGHNQVAQTACPGRHAIAAIPAMNRPYSGEDFTIVDQATRDYMKALEDRLNSRMGTIDANSVARTEQILAAIESLKPPPPAAEPEPDDEGVGAS